MEQVAIRLFEEGDIQSVNDLYGKVNETDRSIEQFRWEFQRGPAGPAIYVVAVDTRANKVVGTQAAIPLHVVNASGEKVLTAKLEDTVVDPGYRHGDIVGKMYALISNECRKAGVVATWGFTYATEQFSNLGFEIAFRCDFGFIVFDAIHGFRHLEGLRKNRSFLAKAKVAMLVLASRLKYGIHIGFKATEGYSISKDVQTSLEHLTPSQPGSFFLRQDPKFLHWRLRDNPYATDHLYYSLVNESGKSVGSVVFSSTGDVAYVTHMVFARNLSEETRRHFLNAVVADMSGRTNVLRAWGFTHNEAGREDIELLKGSGFVFTDQGISFVWKTIDEGSSLNVNNFVLSRLASQDA